nr:hypothetical protein [Tanacetum cinerariifolium]
MDIEEEEPEEDLVEEPEPLAGQGDQFDAHHNPQPGNMNGWVDDHDDDEEEDDENEDVDIEDDDAEIIFPYEVQGDQTPSPGDESSDFEFEAEEADHELEVEEPDGAPEATIGNGGLAPCALRRDLEALRRHDRIRDAESGTSRTEIALLGSEAGIEKMKREIFHHDLCGVEETLGNVVERLKVLESEENATLKKKLADKDMFLDLTRMDRDRAERRLSESIWWNERFYLEMVRKGAVSNRNLMMRALNARERCQRSLMEMRDLLTPVDLLCDSHIMPPKPMSEARIREIIRDQFATSMNEFMANMNNWAGGSGGPSGSVGAGGGGNDVRTGVRGAGPTVPELTGCTYVTFTKCDPLPFNGTEGAVGLCQWFEKLESVFQISECKEKDKVKFAMATFHGRALTWWNRRTKAVGIEAANNTPWRIDIDGYTNRFHELALLCPRMVEPEAVKVEQLIQDKADEETGGEKKKGEGDRGCRGDNRREHNRRQN